MTAMAPDRLKYHIAAVIGGLRDMHPDEVEDLTAALGDELAADRDEDLFVGAILDGLRWGHHAAVVVELGGGALLRVQLQGGIGITHEWAVEAEGRPQIDAALEALGEKRG